MTNSIVQMVTSEVLPDSVVIQSMAAAMTSTPAMGKALYRPVLVVAMPEPMAVMNRPAIIGSISRPELAAEVPEAICRNVGMKAMAENMPRPIAAPSAVATTKVGLPNRDSGMIGCTARCSTSTKASTETAKAAIRARVQPSVQPRSPPKSVKKTSEVVAADRVTMPA